MRTNLPVTHNEFVIPDGVTLVSTTDLQSHITYCNPAFIAVSGYDREELIGQPHNIVRHPDMPQEAFRDMWETLKGGQPWSALVKNRRKNGDHYWVVANATPIMENGQAVGFMSVRTKPTREQVQAAEALYARMRTERDAGQQVVAQGGHSSFLAPSSRALAFRTASGRMFFSAISPMARCPVWPQAKACGAMTANIRAVVTADRNFMSNPSE